MKKIFFILSKKIFFILSKKIFLRFSCYCDKPKSDFLGICLAWGSSYLNLGLDVTQFFNKHWMFKLSFYSILTLKLALPPVFLFSVITPSFVQLKVFLISPFHRPGPMYQKFCYFKIYLEPDHLSPLRPLTLIQNIIVFTWTTAVSFQEGFSAWASHLKPKSYQVTPLSFNGFLSHVEWNSKSVSEWLGRSFTICSLLLHQHTLLQIHGTCCSTWKISNMFLFQAL